MPVSYHALKHRWIVRTYHARRVEYHGSYPTREEALAADEIAQADLKAKLELAGRRPVNQPDWVTHRSRLEPDTRPPDERPRRVLSVPRQRG